MKLNLSWIQDIINIKLSSNKLLRQLIRLGYEIESSNNLFKDNNINNKIVLAKIIYINNLPNNKYLYTLYFGRGIKRNFITTQYINDFLYKKVIIILSNYFVKIDESDINLIYFKENIGFVNYCKFLLYNYFTLNEGKHYMYSIVLMLEKLPLGILLNKYVNLTEKFVKLKPAFNRIDLKNVLGVCREIDVLNNKKCINIHKYKPLNEIKSKISINLITNKDYFFYTGIEIINVNIRKIIPLWIYSRLLLSKKIYDNPLLNIIHYIFIETGVFFNIYDLDIIGQEILITSRNNQNIFTTSHLTNEVLSIASCDILNTKFINHKSKNLYIESISLTQDFLSNTKHIDQYKKNILNIPINLLQSIIIDSNLQIYAINYVTKLITKYFGGLRGKIKILGKPKKNFIPETIHFNKKKVMTVIGQNISLKKIKKILKNLSFKIYLLNNLNWKINPPIWRIDVFCIQDIIEEILKFHGYEKLKIKKNDFSVKTIKSFNKYNNIEKIKNFLVNKGYQEIITYSLIDSNLININKNIKIINPISQEYSGLRTSLLNGLLNNIIYNQNYQVNRLKLFELGYCYQTNNNKDNHDLFNKSYLLSGAMYGKKYERKWCFKSEEIDIFDLKGEIEDIFELLSINPKNIEYNTGKTISHIFLNKNYCNIYINNIFIGQIGYISNNILNLFKIKNKILFFEIKLDLVLNIKEYTKYNINEKNISYLPIYERDFSFILNEDIPSISIIKECKEIMKKYLLNIDIFDVYADKQMKLQHKKSIGINLILQDKNTTLSNEKINKILEDCINKLKEKFQLTLRIS